LASYLQNGQAALVHASYTRMREFADAHGWREGVDAILLDLGVSSMQLDRPERGFAFMRDGPLDMRFNPQSGDVSAADIVNTWDIDELTGILREYGEEPDARRIARVIVNGRPYERTRQLADAIKASTR